VIDDRVAQGQLDDCRLTLRDLQVVRESFVATLKGMFHGRLRYPDEAQRAASSTFG
jgi:membrane-associated HD superfamily phosphohydrolase